MQPDFEALRAYLNELKPTDQRKFAKRCKTSVGYLRKAISTKPEIDVQLAAALDRESGGRVDCRRLRPGVDWEYLAAKQGNSGGSEQMAAAPG